MNLILLIQNHYITLFLIHVIILHYFIFLNLEQLILRGFIY
jgi:hypothetical protein